MVLSAEQIEALDRGEPVPLSVEGRACVLLNAATFGDDADSKQEWEPGSMLPHVAKMMAEDWDDPAMSVYDDTTV